jgi:hypothetical protein
LPAPTANITWAPTTTFLDENQASLVKSIDEDTANDAGTGSITLDSAGVKAAGLDLSTGRIIVIYRQAMNTITSSTDDGTTVTLQTGPASLEQAATHAELDWQQASEFSPAAAALAMAKTKSKDGRTYTILDEGNHVSVTFPAGTYSLTVDMTLYGDKLDFAITGSKAAGEGTISAKMTATGEIGRFVEHHHVVIDDSVLTQYEADNNHMEGTVTLTAVAAASGNDTIDLSPEPYSLLKWPGFIGPLYVEWGTSIQFVVNAVVPESASVNVSTVIDYNSDLGFTANDSSFNAMGTIGSYSIDKGMVLQSGAPGDVTFNAGIGFPRLSLSLFHSLAEVWVQPAFLVGGAYTFFPACQTATADYLASCGYDVSVFGHGPSADKTLYEKKQPLLTAGSCDGGT